MKKIFLTLAVMAAALQVSAQTTDNFDPASMGSWELVYNEKGQGVVTDGKMSIVNTTDTEWISVFRKEDTANTADFDMAVTAEPTSFETQTFGLVYNYDRQSGNFDAFVLKNNKASIILFRDGKATDWYETTIEGKDLKKMIRMGIRNVEAGINFTVNGEVAFTLKNKPITHKGVGLIAGPSTIKASVKFDSFSLK